MTILERAEERHRQHMASWDLYRELKDRFWREFIWENWYEIRTLIKAAEELKRIRDEKPLLIFRWRKKVKNHQEQ